MPKFFKESTSIYRYNGTWYTTSSLTYMSGGVPLSRGGTYAAYGLSDQDDGSHMYRLWNADRIATEDGARYPGWENARYAYQQGHLYDLPLEVSNTLAAAGYTSDPIPAGTFRGVSAMGEAWRGAIWDAVAYLEP